MARFTKKKISTFDDYDEIRGTRLTKAERDHSDQEAAVELEALKSMQETLTHEVAAYMQSQEIGIVELTKRLRTSTRQTSRIMKGEANITLATLAELATFMGRVPRLVFEDIKPMRQRKRV